MIENTVFTTTLVLLAAALNGKDCPVFDIALWPEIKKELKNQAILSLVSETLLKSDLLSREEKQKLTRDTVVNIYKFRKVMTQQQETLKLLDNCAIPAIVLKGAGCAQYYPKPWLRQFGDIDLLVLPKDFEKARTLFVEKSYTQLVETDAVYQRHIGFYTPSEVEIELHRFFSSSDSKGQNTLLDRWIFDALPHSCTANLQEFSAPVLPPLENGLVILAHVNQHLGSGLGLRQIADWMMFVKARLDDSFWEEAFREKAAAIGLDQLARTLTRMCQLYLGLDEALCWCRDADDGLAEELMLYVLHKGNFGIKIDRDSQKTLTVVHHFSNPVKALRYLTKGGMIHMKEAGLKPVKSLAWLYQIGHLIRKTTNRENRRNLNAELKRGSEETDLLKRLKVTRL